VDDDEREAMDMYNELEDRVATLEDDYEVKEALTLQALEERVTRLENFEHSYDADDDDDDDADDDGNVNLHDEFEDLKVRSTHRLCRVCLRSAAWT